MEGEYMANFSREQIRVLNYIQLGIELTYLLDFGLSFLLQYTPKDQESSASVDDVSLTSINYVKTDMVYDLIPLIPLTEIFHFEYCRLFYLFKCIRISKSLDLLNTKSFMDAIKKFQRRMLERKMKMSPEV